MGRSIVKNAYLFLINIYHFSVRDKMENYKIL